MLTPCRAPRPAPLTPLSRLPLSSGTVRRGHDDDDIHPENPKPSAFPMEEMSVEELVDWAWEHRRADILAKFGIYVGSICEARDHLENVRRNSGPGPAEARRLWPLRFPPRGTTYSRKSQSLGSGVDIL